MCRTPPDDGAYRRRGGVRPTTIRFETKSSDTGGSITKLLGEHTRCNALGQALPGCIARLHESLDHDRRLLSSQPGPVRQLMPKPGVLTFCVLAGVALAPRDRLFQRDLAFEMTP